MAEQIKQRLTKMAQAAIEEKDEKPEGQFPSWSARILTRIGSTLIAPPADLKMPADWYFVEADRVMPGPGQDTWQLQRYRVYADNLRWEIKFRLARFAIVANFAVILVLAVMLGAFGAAKAAKSAWDGRSSSSAVQQESARSDQEQRARLMNGSGNQEPTNLQQELENFKRQQRGQ